MKKTVIASILVGLTVQGVAYAEVSHKNAISERQDIVNTFKKKDAHTIEIGFYPGSLEKTEPFYWANTYMPLANYLSTSTDNIVTLVPERKIVTFKNFIKAQRYKYIYVNPEVAVLAQEIAYTPIVKAANNIESVTLALASSNIKNQGDLSNKEVYALNNEITGNMAKAYFIKNNINAVLKTELNTLSQLVQKLNTKSADAIIVRKSEADDLIANNKGKYDIVNSNGISPGFIFMAHVTTPDAEVEKFKQAFLAIDGAQEGVARSLNEKKAGKLFDDYNRDFLKDVRAMVSLVETDYGRYVYNPVKNNYQEGYTLFIKKAAPAAAAPAAAPTAAPAAAPASSKEEQKKEQKK